MPLMASGLPKSRARLAGCRQIGSGLSGFTNAALKLPPKSADWPHAFPAVANHMKGTQMFDPYADDDPMPSLAPAIAALERAVAAMLIDENASDAVADAGAAALKELVSLMEARDRDAAIALFRLCMLREDLRKAAARRRRARKEAEARIAAIQVRIAALEAKAGKP